MTPILVVECMPVKNVVQEDKGDSAVSNNKQGQATTTSKENAEGEEEDVKSKKPKKPTVMVAEAAAKIDAADLAFFLSNISGPYEVQQDFELPRKILRRYGVGLYPAAFTSTSDSINTIWNSTSP
ncbi:hypothetical protein POTOM_030074 [Populus tomentosa]|uniref:Uncharacterized protein n=1 Tax=Populus tomentosa TaxID=118781 RepID=A0A8X8CTL7_POPTO|nr:hypothetical protein POTOM_030074 [Populus tomentosa]